MSISTFSLSSTTRASILRIQTELRDANKELTTGRHADVGLTLGRLTGNTVSLRAQETSLKRTLDSNKLVTSRLSAMDDAMEAVAATGEELTKSLIAGTTVAGSSSTLAEQARSALQQLAGALNLNIDGQYLFSGANTDVKSIKSSSAPAPAVVATKFDDFLANHVPPLAPTTLAAAPAGVLTEFYDPASASADAYHTLFTVDANWKTNWSDASDAPVESRISRTETIKSSLSANEAAFRKIASAYSMIADLDTSGLGAEAKKAVVAQASIALKGGLEGVTQLRADVGTRLKRVESADAALTQQQDIVEAAVGRLEGVDETEAGLRINQLKTLLETSFAVTGRLQNLSILNYL